MAEDRIGHGQTGPRASFLVAALAISLLLAGCGEPAPRVYSFSGETMGTTYHVKLVPGETEVPEDLDKTIFATFDDIDRKMSTYKPESELNRLNRVDVGREFRASQELLEVLLLSREVYQQTGGAFDPTVGPLVNLWGFGPEFRQDEIPADDDIGLLLEEVGFDALVIDPEAATVVKVRPLALDLSAVAKGYAADQVARRLQGHGLTDFMVEVGGEMALAGRNADGLPWQIAIEKPTAGSRSVQQIVGITDAGVATSGEYRNFFEKDGVRYSHTLDPRTGYPVIHGLASVTVVTRNSAYADALATAFMVMGTDGTLDFARERNIPVYTMSKSDKGFVAAYSPAFEAYLSEDQ